MKSSERMSSRKLIGLTIVFYVILLLSEAGVKALAVWDAFARNKVTSSLTSMVNSGIQMLALSIGLYIGILLIIYGLFAIINGHYASLLRTWIESRRPGSSRYAQSSAFLAVNGIFLAGVYGLNASLYPASDLALFKWRAGPLQLIALALLALYLLGFIVLNIRFARRRAMALGLFFWALMLISPFDPSFVIHRIFRSRPDSSANGPNVIIIGVDSLNPRHAGYAGYPLPITPRLDEFLKENVVFDNCYTPIARTFPAWYSILTGQYPVTNGVRLNLIKRKYIKSARLCLGHLLKEAGFTTAHLTDEVRFSNITADEGFDVLRHPVMGIKDFLFGSFHDFSLTNVFFNNPLGSRIFPFLRYNRAVAHLYDGRYFLNEVETTLDQVAAKGRFFLVAHLCIAHWPYLHAKPKDFSHLPGADPRMSLYDSAVSKADAQLGRILDSLKARGLYDNSIVVVLSDHGESAEGHGTDLQDSEQNRTLLAWKPAGQTGHRTVERLVRTIDIAPTLLDLLGIEAGGLGYDGVSLRPWVQGTTPAVASGPDSVIMETEFSLDMPGGIGLAVQSMIEQGAKFYEFDRSGLITVRDDYYDILIRRRNRAILTSEWKLVHDIMVRRNTEIVRTSLYDILNDPGCRTDVSNGRPDIANALRERLRLHYGEELRVR